MPREPREERAAESDRPPREAHIAGLRDFRTPSLEAVERRHIADVLTRYPTLGAAAKVLGIDPSTLYRKRERFGLS